MSKISDTELLVLVELLEGEEMPGVGILADSPRIQLALKRRERLGKTEPGRIALVLIGMARSSLRAALGFLEF